MPEELIEDSGLVTSVAGQQVSVELIRGGGCKSCQMQGLCLKKNTPAVFNLTTELQLEVGDRVQLEISAAGRTLASLMVFGLPLAALFAGFLIAQIWFSELASIGLGFLALGLAFLLLRSLDKKLAKQLSISIARKL